MYKVVDIPEREMQAGAGKAEKNPHRDWGRARTSGTGSQKSAIAGKRKTSDPVGSVVLESPLKYQNLRLCF